MARHSHDDQGVERTLLIDRAPDDLQWIYLNVKMATASHIWHNKDMIKDLEQAYRAKEKVKGVEFEPIEANERACNYDIGWFVMFYGDIFDQLSIDPPFTYFQASILNWLSLCPV